MFAISLATSFTVESAVSLESLFLQATIAKAEIRIKNKLVYVVTCSPTKLPIAIEYKIN